MELGLELHDDAAADHAESVLRRVEHVVEVRRPPRAGDAWRLDVQPAAAEGRARQQLVAVVAAAGLPLTSLRTIVPSLDDIYRLAVQRSSSAGRSEAA